MLYTLLQSPWQCDIDSLLLLMQEGDDLLLMQDGVTAALEGSQMFIKLQASPAALWVLEEDVVARGLVEQISTKVARLDYTGFVTMTVKHQQQVAW
ncbi:MULTISPECIES: sulfurtransferase complex subunit TusB [unclassified Pantoea]|uniref:sulfurtransferase complex subunit TusB n=1 Tax=unclassified Pantoea TaxID=2630326 RepID=UPI00301E4149